MSERFFQCTQYVLGEMLIASNEVRHSLDKINAAHSRRDFGAARDATLDFGKRLIVLAKLSETMASQTSQEVARLTAEITKATPK